MGGRQLAHFVARTPRAAAASTAAARDRWLAAALSLAAHLSILLALLWAWKPPPRSFEATPVAVTLESLPAWTAAPKRAAARAAAQPSPARDLPPRKVVVAQPFPVPATVAPRVTQAAPGSGGSSGLSDADFAGAASAGADPPGGACDMAHRLQTALRRDPLVQAAVAQARRSAAGDGLPILIWNGDWIQSDGEDGKGLAAVREAVMWEVAFAPPACRAEPVRGYVLVSLGQGAAGRLALGSRQWRWSDLLTLRPAEGLSSRH